MVTEHNLKCFDPFTVKFIRSKVRKLIGRAGFTESDSPDLAQEFAIDLIRRREIFDRDIADWEAFVVVVCENRYATILEYRCAKKRSVFREAGSLNRPITNDDGNQIDCGSMVPESHHAWRTGQHRRSEEEATNLAQDVADVLDQMPPMMRKVCKIVMRDSKAAAARELGISQGTLYEILGRILTRFENADLRDYLN